MDELQTPPPNQPLMYEETSVITPGGVAPSPEPQPISEPTVAPEVPTPAPEPISALEPIPQIPEIQPAKPKTPPTIPPQPRQMSPLVIFILLAILFGLGVLASSYFRQLLPGTPSQKIAGPTTILTPTPTPDPYANWKTFYVISGVTHKAIDGVSFRMPPTTPDLFCDGVGCSSQGTSLFGGTRFTVAARGAGQTLADYRGKIVTDANGRPFDTTPATIAGRPAVLFTGNFTGRTVTGFTFTKMSGAMISVTDTLSLEVNHFTPIGVTADFAADDILFQKILGSFIFTLPQPLPSPSLIPTSTPSATSSGS